MVFKPIYEKLKCDDRFDIFFMNSLRDNNIFEGLGIPNEKFLKAKIAFFVNWDLYIASDVFQPHLLNKLFFKCLNFQRVGHIRKPRMVLLAHGISEKKYTFEDDSQRIYNLLASYDKVFLSSKAQYERFSRLYSGSFAKNLEYVGYPRLFQLINGTANKEKLRKKLKIQNSLPIILFAPTWGRYGSLEQFGTKIIEQLLSLQANILFKMHDNTYLELSYAAGKNHKKLKKFEGTPNFHVINDYDIYPYLHLTDLLIADYGSLIFEYLTLKKPAIFIDLNLHNRQVVSNFHKLELLRKSCITISSPYQLEEALKLVSKDSSELKVYRQELVKEYIESAPYAAENIVNSICSLLNLGNSNKREVL
jgi:hypothetical protein